MPRLFRCARYMLEASAPCVSGAGSPLLFEERFPFPADCAAAESLRRRELKRGMREGMPSRAVLLRYSDGLADLVLTADRACFTSAEFDALAASILGDAGTSGVSESSQDAQCDGAPARSFLPRADRLRALSEADLQTDLTWASSVDSPANAEEIAAAAPLARDLSPACLVAAVGIVLGRFSRSSRPVLAVFAGDARTVHAAIVCVDAGAADTRMLLATVGADLEDPILDTAETGAELEQFGRSPAIKVAVVTDRPRADPRCAEYRAFTSTPYPITVERFTTKSGVHQIVCRSTEQRVDARLLQHFAAAVANVTGQLADGHSASDIRLLPARPSPPIPSAAESFTSTIDAGIASIAATNGSSSAVRCGQRRMTFGELDASATRVSLALRAQGVRRGDRVAIALDRDLELVVVMLAVWKSGASYVPIDIHWPSERIEYVVKDAGVKLLVAVAPLDCDSAEIAVVHPEALLSAANEPNDEPAEAHAASDEAYVIYTSGSTGRPKGVSVPHANVISLQRATQREFSLAATDVWTMFHSAAFDFSVWEIWICLLTGGSLVIVPHETSRDPAQFIELLEAERVTVLSQTPSSFEQLIERQRRRPCPLQLRMVVLGGEPLPPAILPAWFDCMPESVCSVVNMFGITETTVHVTQEVLSRGHALNHSKSVGRPLEGWLISVRDDFGHELPAGAIGEIWVGGAGVATGYVNRPELTAKRFVNRDGVRYYRSGDCGRRLPDGQLEHLGRIDNQVKLRGFRIELDEIRAVLLQTPGVEHAAVVLQPDEEGGHGMAHIAAFVVVSQGSTRDIRRRLSEVLPEYMVPASIRAVATLPMTSNGKLDLARLRAQRDSIPEVQPQGRDNIAALVHAAFTRVLGVSVRDDDNFFDLGGNSLAAIRVVADLQKSGIETVSTRDVYFHQTTVELTRYLTTARAG